MSTARQYLVTVHDPDERDGADLIRTQLSNAGHVDVTVTEVTS